MDCYINKKIDYQNISKIIKQHKEFLVKMVSKIAHKKIYPGIDFSKVQGMLTFDDIPGLKEAGWDQEDYNKTLPEDMNLEDQCNFILNKLKQHQSAWPFKEPVNREEVKDYYDVIKEPMDL